MGEGKIDIMEIPRIFVQEDNNEFPYICNYTSHGLPYYVPPDNKYPQKEGYTLTESLFLPISNYDFNNNKGDFFYGFRIFIASKDPYVVGLIFNPESASVVLQLKYEICRVRYYPTGEKSICVDRQNDPIFPTQTIDVKSSGPEFNNKVICTISNIIDTYCSYYLDNQI